MQGGNGCQQLRPVLRQALLQFFNLCHLALQAFQQGLVLPDCLRIRQQAADLVQREAGVLGHGNDLQHPQGLGTVCAVPIFLPFGGGKQTAFLVKTDARSREARACSKFADLHGRSSFHLDIEVNFNVRVTALSTAAGTCLMHTILGATGQISVELARELHRSHTTDLRLVSRQPRKIHDSDTLVTADLLDAAQTARAVHGSHTVYFTAGLPPDTALWETQFPLMLRNALDATRAAGARFVYFDNTYMYPQDSRPLTEDAPFAPVGRKGQVRAAMASMVLEAMARGDMPVLIGRAPEFYGPGRTQSITNTLVLDRILAGQKPRVPVRDDTLRTLIWTPDASRALAALGNTPDAFGQTWHLPCDDDRLTYRQFIALASEVWERPLPHQVLRPWMLAAAGLVSTQVRELRELLPRYGQDNLFDSSKFKRRFPAFEVTRYRQGLAQIHAASRGRAQ